MTGQFPVDANTPRKWRMLLSLMLAVFAISVGFGVLLPELPDLVGQMLGAGTSAARVSRATGFLTALYMFALFLCAPVWGQLSDRWGRRPVLLIGLTGFGATMLVFAFLESLPALYMERALSGLFAAAVTPVALATLTDFSATRADLGRRLTFVSLAGVSGFLLGPALGVALTRASGGSGGAMMVPLAATGGLALVAALAVALTVRHLPSARPEEARKSARKTAPQVVRWLLALGFVVSAGVAVFEVGLALRGRQDLGLDPSQIAMMFTLCSGVMIVVQAVVFSPLVRPEITRWLIAPAFAIMAAALITVPLTTDFRLMLMVVGAVAASAGILSPILTYWVASHAGHKSGAELGKQTAAASLGAALGSAAGGLLYDVTWLPNAAFVLTSGVIALAVWPGLWLPGQLVERGASVR
ncbi:MAG: MFS transporter [Pseudomonadota bacterium]